MTNEEQNEPIPQNNDQNNRKPDYMWREIYDLGENSCEIEPAAEAQNRMLNKLLPHRKKAYSLPDWYFEIKKVEQEDLLYSLCGVVHPTEANMLHCYVDQWQKSLIREKMKEFSVDDEEDSSQRTITVPRATFENFIKDPYCANFMLEKNENLLLRLNSVKGIIHKLDQALYLEGTRQRKEEWESAMEELVGQYAFPESASSPQDEYLCWVWMNKMLAPIKGDLWHLNLNATREVMSRFNWFRIHRCFADLLDYADNPVCTQRVEGKLLRNVELPWVSAKILMTAGFLLKNGFLDKDALMAIGQMSPEERKEQEKNMKRAVVSSFLSDMSKSAPDNEMFEKMLNGFERYFQPILRQTGFPSLKKTVIERRNKKGETKLGGVIDVKFYEQKSKHVDPAMKSEKKQSDLSKTKPINRPETGLSK